MALVGAAAATAACGNDRPAHPAAGGTANAGFGGSATADASYAGDSAAAAVRAAVIDDFEDGDLDILSQEERHGVWFTFDDTTEDGSLVDMRVESDSPGSGLVLHASADRFVVSGGGLVATLNGAFESYTTYDASAYAGVTFRARRGSGDEYVRFSISDIRTAKLPGVACDGCGDHFGKEITLSAEWQTYSFTWDELRQLGWGGTLYVAVDPAQVVYLQWQGDRGLTLDLYLDDVAFLLEGPSAGASGTGGAGAVGGSGGEAPYVAPIPAVKRSGQLRVEGNELRGEDGQRVQLKGMSSAWLNWETDGYAESKAGLEWMRDNWGLEVIRAAMGVEEANAYLTDPVLARTKVETIIQNAIELGVYAIVDWHTYHAQDYEAEAAEFFGSLAAAYGEYPNVIWEPYNEPIDVDWATSLKPYHETIVARIREHDPDNVIVLGTPNWSQDVDVVAADPVVGTNLMYALHFYACSHRPSLRVRADNALAAGLALFVTEWGATAADGGLNGVVCEEEARDWHAWMNENGISWTAWKLDNCLPDATCVLAASAPLDGGWTAEYLHGHGKFVRDRMRED